ncbi:MAG: ABC transporter ATP-binding protein [bacterium]|nr:MAG: ABC transporter ATP-binding protein [bacterium]KAF0148338.1 MAG: ABC transporter ATP-binding protein [bacterium]KAF0167799.1 MAG: ABC transporter ATP-binding protein [bacterium]
MIELAGVGKTFNPGRDNEFHAVREVSLSIEAGRVTALRGPSGSGKTTLLGLIGGLTRPSVGRVRLHGRDISALPERFLTALRRDTFGFVFQQFQLIRDLSVLDNVMLPAVPTGRAHADIHARALRLLDEVGLGQRAAARVQWLSGGEAQRAAIARALINDPSVILADEPTAHLDSALSRQILEILAELRRRGRTLVIASHDPLVFEMDLVERVVDLRDGRVLTVHGLSTVPMDKSACRP